MATVMVKGDPQGSRKLEGKVYKTVPCPCCGTNVLVGISYPEDARLCHLCTYTQGMPEEEIEMVATGGETAPVNYVEYKVRTKDRFGPRI